MMNNSTSDQLLSFIRESTCSFLAVKTASELLTKNGYKKLGENEKWELTPGGRYYVTRNQSAIIAFNIPSDTSSLSFMISASHSDSPCFKVKHNPETDASGYTKINVEAYGGMLRATWLDRPLSASGRVTYLDGSKVVSKLIDLKKPLFMIPSVAIHMNRSANENASYNLATDMQPITGTSLCKGSFMRLVSESAGVNEGDIISHELFLYPVDNGTVWGANDEFVSSPRLDDLQCAYASLRALTETEASGAVAVAYVSDNEEVGSGTKQGADSTFLYDTLSRINACLGSDDNALKQALASSFMVSADNAHAVHPNHPEYADGSHRPVMNGGIVIKHAASQTYTTDAISSALFTALCKKADVPLQHFVNRSDMRGGSTLGNISGTHVSINTVDIGLPQLAMHSSYETAGVKDTDYLISALKMLFTSSINMTADGEYEVK